MSETNVRELFGPPDDVVVGDEELKARPTVRMRGAGGAYLYKVGRFASVSGDLSVSDVFAIVFDTAGTVIYRMGFGVKDGDRLADIDTDTRSDRRIAR